jgi:splicing factor U2AF subunit
MDVSKEELLKAASHFEDFFEEVFLEFIKFGEIVELVVADNIGEHMLGNTYVKFAQEEQAETCFKTMNGKYYNNS